jgi:hypothetical protein
MNFVLLKSGCAQHAVVITKEPNWSFIMAAAAIEELRRMQTAQTDES